MRQHQQPGSYQIFDLELVDGAGNDQQYYGSAFGGRTDFSKFFPGGYTAVIDK